MTLSPASREVLLALADDELMMGHRHSEWLGVAPFLEEDLAHASIAQDELGHARALYRLVTADIDVLAFGRGPRDYRCAWFVELPCSNWEDTLVRHFLYDIAEQIRWESLLESSVAGLPGLAAKALREEQYHLAHAVPLVQRLLVGTDESRRRVAGSLTRLFATSRGLFEPTAAEDEAVAAGTIESSATLEGRWVAEVRRHLNEADLGSMDWDVPAAGLGGRRGARSEHFEALHANMTSVYALEPGAVW
jgi:ring-1,2-phenylacetyl-CoA epoxidase subunit PaaC